MKKLMVEDFKKALYENDEVTFTFRKKDGSIRIAKGTTKPEVIAETGYVFAEEEKKNAEGKLPGLLSLFLCKPRKKNENVVAFYDIENEEWRSFNIAYGNDSIDVYDKDEPIDVPEEKKVGFYANHSDDELRDLLNIGIVNFTFRKKDGSERKAMGTTNDKYLKENGIILKEETSPHTGVVSFFDIEKNDWRCCKEGSVLEIKLLEKGM